MADPTPYSDLNRVLRELVADAGSILGEHFCGAYLQGSFALGNADAWSDVDFLIVTDDEVDEAQLSALQSMHNRLFDLDDSWAQHLEGSYVPANRLRRVDPSRSPYLYLDNGTSELIRDNHCNSAWVRWILREHGVVLAGPDPKSVVDPVSPQMLRGEVLTAMQEFADWAHKPHPRFGPSAMSRRLAEHARSLLLPTAADVGFREGHIEAGGWRMGSRRPRPRVGESHPTSLGQPARPVATGSPASRRRRGRPHPRLYRLRPQVIAASK